VRPRLSHTHTGGGNIKTRQQHTEAIQAHLDANDAAIQAEALTYAKQYNVSLEIAERDVRDEYIQGYYEGEEAARSGILPESDVDHWPTRRWVRSERQHITGIPT